MQPTEPSFTVSLSTPGSKQRLSRAVLGLLVVFSCAGEVLAASPVAKANGLWAPLPRLFYTPEQRAAVVRARRAETSVDVSGDSMAEAPEILPPPVSTFVLQGVTWASQGASAWINGQPVRNGEMLGERRVHIEPHAVYLRQKGVSDLVLKPGQGSFDEQQGVVDVVPTGVFLKK
jgi:hypothetical protein